MADLSLIFIALMSALRFIEHPGTLDAFGAFALGACATLWALARMLERSDD